MSEEAQYYYLADMDLIHVGDQWTLSDWNDPDLIFTVEADNPRINKEFMKENLKWWPMRRKIGIKP